MYDLSFRKIIEKDIPLIEKWYGMTEYFGYATGFKDFSEVKHRLINSDFPDNITFMIDSEGKTIGFTFAEFFETKNRPILWIYILIIEPENQNRGYGTMAVKKLIDIAKSMHRSFSCIALVSQENEKGLRFWKSSGFNRLYNLENRLKPKQIAIYCKNINS
ncbi:MAG: GNAT family N-acetyltransferase [Clostridiaceae bacterium]|nr:GNAT family N-acetyltransferase [Clostridiaceae bacterium]